ncbi:MAG: hypothetical protein GY811_04140 [Myxococcales bacterium]|nr:hypothetical protein [Myxococcales bacterium]
MSTDTVLAAVQALPVLAELGDESQRGTLLDALPADVAVAGGPVRPAVAAWTTEAHATRDPAKAWESLRSASLAAHADGTPEYSCGVWTGPGSYAGPLQEEPGSATLFGPRPEADYPAASTEAHMAMVRASVSLLGVRANPSGWRVDPRVPSETFSVVLPNLGLRGTPSCIAGSTTAQAVEVMQLVVTLPSGAHSGNLSVKVKAAEVEFELVGDDAVSFSIPVRPQEPVIWSVTAL